VSRPLRFIRGVPGRCAATPCGFTSHALAATCFAAALWCAAAQAQTDDPLAGEDELVPAEGAESADADAQSGQDDQDEAAAEGDASDDTQSAESGTDEAESAAAEVEGEPSAQRALSLHVAAGLGVGTLAFTVPTAQGTQRLPDAPFAAADVAVRLHISPEAALSLETLLAYQSSLGFKVQFDPLFALPEEIAARAERMELSVAPVFRLGAAESGWALAFPVGFAFRAFLPEVHEYPVDKYLVGGPQLRAELWLQLGELVRMRIGPELQWIALVDGVMSEHGACCQGVAIGGQGALEASVGPHFRVAFAYREAHGYVPLDWRFKDVERFLTARLAGEL
jgi:hypothetical protein